MSREISWIRPPAPDAPDIVPHVLAKYGRSYDDVHLTSAIFPLRHVALAESLSSGVPVGIQEYESLWHRIREGDALVVDDIDCDRRTTSVHRLEETDSVVVRLAS